MSKPYLISSFSYTSGVDKYFESLSNITCSPVAFMFEPYTMTPRGVEVFKLDRKYIGNTGRFVPILDALMANCFDLSRWFIFTDSGDVWFQTELPNLDSVRGDIIVCDEGKKFKQIDFWFDKVPKKLLNKEAYNVGSFAMRGEMFLKFLLFIVGKYHEYVKLIKRPDIYPFNCPLANMYLSTTDRMFLNLADTVLFNEFIADKEITTHPTLFTCLSFNLKALTTLERDGLYYNKQGELYSIVHANGNAKLLVDKKK